MVLSRRARILLRVFVILGLAVIYIPLLVVVVNSVNPSRTFGWPPSGVTFEWWRKALDSQGMTSSLWTSVKAGLGATAIALVLGSMAAFAVARYRFFGREAVSFLVILPLALPGVITGIALNNAFLAILGPIGGHLGLATVIVGHATFCIVVVYNNMLARLRRTGGSLEEASADLGARPVQTFRLITLPAVRSALFAGGLLAFALSFDEIIVTTFTAGPGVQTLPVWIFGNLFRPNQAPVVNVVAAALVVLSFLPVWLAQRVGGGESAGGRL
jgi:putative spermidine/putrescine transport system permease protein